MSFDSEYLALRKKREKEKEKKRQELISSKPYASKLISPADEIAPVKPFAPTVTTTKTTSSTKKKDEDDKEWYEKFFKKPELFNDGYQAGDIAKTILGSTGDFALGVVSGAGNFLEGITDTVGYGVADVAEAFGADDFAKSTKEKVKQNIVQKILGTPTEKADKWSVFGDTSDAVAQGLGMVGTLIAGGAALGAAGLGTGVVSAITTGATGLSGFGSGMSEAYQGGATDEEARTYGAIVGASEALSELLFGGLGKASKALGIGKGLSSFDDMAAKKVANMFSSQFAKNLAEYGVKSSAEGAEEVISGIAQIIGKKITYMSEEELGKIWQDENLLEQFVVGSVTSSFAQANGLHKANKTGTDFITGLNENEQKVVDKEVENRIAKEEEDGKTLSLKDKNKIRDRVMEDLDKGYIDTDTIESVLGGETYKTYKDTVDKEDAVFKRFEDLGNKVNATLKEQTEYKQLSEMAEELKQKSNRTQLKEQLSNEVSSLVKDSRLAESYNERYRRGQTFEADLSKYDTKQQETIKKAIESGILNNTNRTHEFVDMVAKLSADKGVPFDFVNNEKIKASGFAVEGKTVNGYKTDEGSIAINIESSKSLDSVVGHEITHILEGTELYAELQKAAEEYATTKGEYDSRLEALREMYEGVYKGEDFDDKIRAELTADIVGDYLFTDADFINRLSTEKPNVFKKLYDEIKYLCKIATAGSKEARELGRVKRNFEKAYKESVENTDTGVKHSLSPEQETYFKDSKVRDENGNLKVMYHGTPNGKFTVFDTYGSKYGLFGQGSYFTDNKSVAESYTNKGKGDDKKVYETYLNITNPIDMDAEADVNAWSKALPEADFTNCTTNEDCYRAMEDYFEDEGYYKYEAAETAMDVMQNMGYDGITHIGGGRVNADGTKHQVYIAFEPEQIKNIDNTAPTKNADIRYSLDDNIDNFWKNDYNDDTHYGENLRDTPAYLKPSKDSEWQVFCRSFANKTGDIVSEERNITIFTAEDQYFVRADGYMSGKIVSKASIDLYNERCDIYDNYSRRDVPDSYDERKGNRQGNNSNGIVSSENEGADSFYVELDKFIENHSEHFRYIREISSDYRRQIDIDNFDLFAEEASSKDGVFFDAEKTKFSLSEDNNGRKLSKEQQDYFKASKAIDEKGNLKVVYHGTRNADFTVFKRNATYFTDSKEMADSYSPNGEMFEGYVNITKPYEIDAAGEKWSRIPIDNDTANFLKSYGSSVFKEDGKWRTTPADIASALEEAIDDGEVDYDGIIIKNIDDTGSYYKDTDKHLATDYIVFNSNQFKNVDNKKPTDNPDINLSLSGDGEIFKDNGRFFGKDILYRGDDIAPTVSKTEKVAPTVQGTVNEDDYAPMTEAEAEAMYSDEEYVNSFTDADMPPEMDAPIYTPDTSSIKEKSLKNISAMAKDILFLTPKERRAVEDVVQKYSTSESQNETELFNDIKKLFGEKSWSERIEEVAEIQQTLKGYKLNVSPFIKRDITDYTQFMRRNFGKITFSKEGMAVDTAYMELSADYPNFFPSDIINPTDQLLQMVDVANMSKDKTQTYELDDDVIQEATDVITEAVSSYKEEQLLKATEKDSRAVLRDELKKDKEAQKEAETARKQAKRDALSKLSPLERYERKAYARLEADKALLKEELDEAEYNRQVKQLEEETQKKINAYKVANQRKTKQQEYKTQMENLIGDTSTWVDKKLGISYEVNTLRRNLRDIIRDENGKRDITKADAIYDELQGKYNHNEAELNRESNRIKQKYAEMKITKAEDAYIQMLGEFRHNPETTLTEDVVKEFYEKHKNKIDTDKVDSIITDARKLYDDLFVRVNKVLAEQGMKEIPYRKGYFPHFTEEKQGVLGKLFNWKTQNNEIPTSIAGLTEMFEPNRSWQSFNKQRQTDVTDYSFTKGLDTYVQGSLDWIYHIEDIQKRRAFENQIRYTHSEEGIREKIDAIFNSEEYDADEMQEQIDLVYREARNPLNNFVQDFHTATNSLAGKKSTFDRDLEQRTNRKVYSVMTNLSNRVSGNMVAGSVSSALTNFIPITQSWVEVSPVNTLRAMGETIKSTIRDDGTINKSDFLTNRLNKSENLYKTNWDRIGKGVGILMDVIDGFTSQTVWRSKYIQNMSKGMSESEAIKNADIFATNVMADRSRGNQPTLFDSKSPIAKIFTAFQLEVNNQYGYFFKDAPQDIANKSKARLVHGYATAFLGAYAYNALYSSLAGRDAAFDPIRIIADLMKDLGFGDDDEEEEIAPVDVVLNLTNNILEEVPFVGGLLGGGRIPISSAMPYGGIMEAFEGTLQDLSEGNVKTLTKEWLNPVYYLAMPMGGGQIRKTNQGLGMFSDDHPVAGSYTDSGNLRFPVEDTPLNRVQAAVFGQYANENARTYFDEGYAPLKEKQIQEYKDVDMPIKDYWQYREDLKELDTLEEKFDFIADMDLPVEKKNILINNIVDRKEKVDLENYDDFENYEEFDFYSKNTEKYNFLQDNGVSYKEYKADEDTKEKYDSVYSWWKTYPEKVTVSKAVTDNVIEYRGYTSELNDIRADKDEDGKSISGSAKEKKKAYIWSLDIDEGAKYVLFKNEYNADDTYNNEILDYLFNREDLTYEEVNTICEELGFKVNRETGYISWD